MEIITKSEINSISDINSLYNRSRIEPTFEELVKFIKEKYNLKEETIKLIWNKAYEQGHSSGEQYNYLEDEIDYAIEIIESALSTILK